jgi:hypothetical protein
MVNVAFARTSVCVLIARTSGGRRHWPRAALRRTLQIAPAIGLASALVVVANTVVFLGAARAVDG